MSSRKSATLSILDIGTSKVVCLIAELNPAEANERLRGRTHVARIIGIGHQRSLGLKGGAIIDLEGAERAIRAAVDAAERMAKVEVQSVIVNLTGGRLGSQHYAAGVDLRAGAVGDSDVKRVLAAAATHAIRPGKAVLHALPTGYALDGHARRARSARADRRQAVGRHACRRQRSVCGRAMSCSRSSAAISRSRLSWRRPMRRASRCWSTTRPRWASSWSIIGGGTTSLGVFSGGHLMHADAIAVGGNHITMDVARGLSTRVVGGRAPEDAAWLLHLQRLRRARHDLRAAGRR